MNAGTPASVPAGLYIHVPFCSAICPYCDFAVARARTGDLDRYVDAIVAEIEWCSEPWRFDSVYFGGGTPSLLSLEQLQRLWAAITDRFELVEPWVFLEANPEDVDSRAVEEWRSFGVRTLSLGVQSFDDSELKRLGRRHRSTEARQAVATAVEAGFHTTSLDLIYGLEGQRPATWRANLDVAASIGVDHVSCYQLTFHEGTPFGRALASGKLAELDHDAQADFFLATHDVLAANGLDAYEVSNFARSPAHRSRHNLKYWSHVPYLGIGPSAHSYRDRERWWNARDWREYTDRVLAGSSAEAGREQLDDNALALEAIMLRLRTVEGVDLDAFRRRFGVDLVDLNRDRLVSEPRLEVVDGYLRATASGLAVADGLAARLVFGEESS